MLSIDDRLDLIESKLDEVLMALIVGLDLEVDESRLQ